MELNLPKNILDDIQDNATSLGEHPAYPPEDEEQFLAHAMKIYFNDLCKSINVEENNIDKLFEEMQDCMTKCKKIEIKHREELQSLAMNVIYDIFKIPDDTIQIETELVDNVSIDKMRMTPESTEDFSFDTIDDMKFLKDEIYKRRMLNALVAGAADDLSQRTEYYLSQVFQIDPELPSLYKKIMAYNDLLIFFEKENDIEDSNSLGGRVDVTINSNQDQVLIKAQAILFPVLIYETIKGILELAIAHGLPNEREKAEYVMKKSDFRLAELWDMRIGCVLWNIIVSGFDAVGSDVQDLGANFILMTLAELKPEDFNKTLAEIFAHTKQGAALIQDIQHQITEQKDADDFDNFIKSQTDDIELHDDYCSPDDLLTEFDY